MVAMSRLVYRKGIDLIAHVIPEMCRTVPNMDFILGEHRLLQHSGAGAS